MRKRAFRPATRMVLLRNRGTGPVERRGAAVGQPVGDDAEQAGVRVLRKPYVPDQLEAAIHAALQAIVHSPVPFRART